MDPIDVLSPENAFEYTRPSGGLATKVSSACVRAVGLFPASALLTPSLERFWFAKSLEYWLRLSLVYCNTKDKPLQTSAFPIKFLSSFSLRSWGRRVEGRGLLRDGGRFCARTLDRLHRGLTQSGGTTQVRKSFGLLNRVDQNCYELEVASAQGRWIHFKAG